jgi:hypothetical protein
LERAAFIAFSAAAAALSGCGQGASPSYDVDRGSAVVDEMDDESKGAQGDARGAPIDGPEEVTPFCQSQFFGMDPLADEPAARSCSYALLVSVLNPANVVVEISGAARASGSEEDGWQLLADGTTVLLLGAACDEVLAGADLALSAFCE